MMVDRCHTEEALEALKDSLGIDLEEIEAEDDVEGASVTDIGAWVAAANANMGGDV